MFTGLLGPLVKSQHQLQPLSARGNCCREDTGSARVIISGGRLSERRDIWIIAKGQQGFYYRRGDGGEFYLKKKKHKDGREDAEQKAVQRREARWKQHVGHDQEFAVREHRGDGIQAAEQRDEGKQEAEKFTTAISLTRHRTRSSAPPLRGFDYAH